MAEAIEITTFQLVKDHSFADFVAANVEVDAWLVRQRGFKSRRLGQGPDGEVIDVLMWSTAEAGRRAVRKLMTELSDAPVHSLIDQSTVDWRLVTVGHSLGVQD